MGKCFRWPYLINTTLNSLTSPIIKSKQWGITDSMWHHGASKPSELMAEVARFDIRGMLNETSYTTPTLVIDAESEERGQAKELYEAIPDTVPNKKYLYFTAEEAAQLHVQPGATGLFTMRTFDWLDEVLATADDDDDGDDNVDEGDEALPNSSGSRKYGRPWFFW